MLTILRLIWSETHCNEVYPYSYNLSLFPFASIATFSGIECRLFWQWIRCPNSFVNCQGRTLSVTRLTIDKSFVRFTLHSFSAQSYIGVGVQAAMPA